MADGQKHLNVRIFFASGKEVEADPQIKHVISRRLNKASSKKRKKGSNSTRQSEFYDANSNMPTWIKPAEFADVIGPLYFAYESNPPRCISVNADYNTLYFNKLSTETVVEPENISQVWVSHPLPSAPKILSLRAPSSQRYLSSDTVGEVTAIKEAIGLQEQWMPEFTPDGIAWKNMLSNCYLTVDEKTWMLRADSETLGPQQVFSVRCQTQLKVERELQQAADSQQRERDEELDTL